MTMNKFYAVAAGSEPGIYPTWEEARKQVEGYPNSSHRRFSSFSEAENWLKAECKRIQRKLDKKRDELLRNPPPPPQPVGYEITLRLLQKGANEDQSEFVATCVYDVETLPEAASLMIKHNWTAEHAARGTAVMTSTYHSMQLLEPSWQSKRSRS